MPFDARFLSTLTCLSPRRIAEIRSSDARSRPVSTFEVENQLRPADLYCYLHARFGRPNGFQNFLRTDDSDNLIHWHWTLGHDDGLLDVQGTNFRTLFIASGLRQPRLHRVDDLVVALKSDFANHGQGMSRCRKALESWVEFVSPYQRLRRSVEQLMEELEQLKPDEVCEPPALHDAPDPAAREFFIEQWTTGARTLNKAFGICFGIRSMLPVMAEAFINLLLFCLMKKEMRADDRLPGDWTERYNVTPVLIETFVETPRYTGAVYRASGWLRVGTTQGRGRYDRDKRYDKPRKDVWLRPLRRDWRRALNR